MPGKLPDPPDRHVLAFSPESLRWVMGLFCAFGGAFVLVAPHRFASPPYQALASFRGAWGIAALAAGVALLSVAVMRPRPWARLAAHILGSVTLLSLAASFARDLIWSGMVAYVVLGTATALAGFLPPERTIPRGAPGRDLFALAMALIAVANGAGLVFIPDLFEAYFAMIGTRLFGIGALLLVGGLLLAAVQIRKPGGFSPPLQWAAHLLTGAGFFAYGVDISLPRRAWTGVVLYAVGGVALAFLPWLARLLEQIDTSALRTRLALALATATSLAMVLTAAVTTTQEERLATSQILETRKVEAQAIARQVADWVHLTSARAAVVAATAGRSSDAPLAQRAFLAKTLPLYPENAALVRLDPMGRVIAMAGEVPLDAIDRGGVAEGVRSDPRVGLHLLQLPGEAEPRLALGAPVLAEDGTPAGAVIALTPAGSLAERIERPESNVHLADGFGRIITKRELSPFTSAFASLPANWDRAVLRGEPLPAGHLVAFATVPDLGWVVAVERPRRSALAGVRQGRDMAFLLLLAVVPVTVLLGIFAARRIARPLHTLADAVDQMAAGNPAAPLEPTHITEVSRLSAAFAEMRDRLAERTRESERLARELRARAEALAETDRRKNEFLAMLAHELRNPLGAIANASYVLERLGAGDSPAQRSVAVIQRQIQHLVRLVDDLLDVSRITRGKVELRRERIDLRDPVHHAVDTLRPLVEAKEHELRLELPPDPLPLDADVTRLEQVVGNLLRNAAKYTDPGGLIEVTLRRDPGDGREAVLLVRDNGMGIAPDLLPRVFDLFTQGEQELDRSGAGLGIGLTLVRSLVEMHGGRVEARSEGTGRGSELEVRLPLAPSP
ncbi:MAG TPA: ATP-binding protein [Thermoanaerobaculia bacterium]|nr:ATP-binding protein [Thermoanaerobaculia bacterium]